MRGRPSTALVTGATGFVGTRLVRLLVAEGWTVHAIVRPSSHASALPASVACHVDDGSSDALSQAVEAAEPEACFHLASLVRGIHTADDVPALVAANVAFGARLAEALSDRPGTLLVNAGTYWQHVGGAAYRPAALYAATKQALEAILRYYSDAGLLRVVTLKLYDTYGPGDPRPKLLNLLLEAAVNGDPIAVTGGEQLIDLVHVDDVARAFVAAAGDFADADMPFFESYSVRSGAAVTLRQLAAAVEHVSGRKVHAEWGARPYRQHEMFEHWDAGPLLPGWSPAVTLTEGIESMWS